MTLGEIRNVVNNIAKYKGLNDNTEVILVANDESHREYYERYGEIAFEPNQILLYISGNNECIIHFN